MIAIASTLSACASRHEVVSMANQKAEAAIKHVSSIDLSTLTGRRIDSELVTLEHFQFSENGRKNMLQFRAWEDEQWKEQRVIAVSDTESGQLDVQYDPDEVFGMEHHNYWAGFFRQRSFFYLRSHQHKLHTF